MESFKPTGSVVRAVRCVVGDGGVCALQRIGELEAYKIQNHGEELAHLI